MIEPYPVEIGDREIWLIGDSIEAVRCAYVLDKITVEELEELLERYM